MAKTKIGINGFGRIGRQVLKALIEKHGNTFDIVGINDLVPAATNAHLFKYDSNYGRFKGTVSVDGSDLVINGDKIKIFAQRDPAQIPWGDVGADIVIESTGLFTDGEKAKAHITAGAKKVIISAPAKKEDITIVMGVNEDKYDSSKHTIISNASCTTNGLAPVAKVLHEQFGIERGFLTTVHSYTNSQKLLDLAAPDLRDARAAALNIVPSATGAARAVGLVIPELVGKFTGMAFRVPVADVSAVDLTVKTAKATTYKDICAAMKAAADGPLKGILGYTEEEVVSSYFIHDSRSSIFDAGAGIELNANFFKVVSWYDNEWGYSCRVIDLIAHMARKEGLLK